MSPYMKQWKSMGMSTIRCVVNIAIELATFRVFVIILHEITLKVLSTNVYCNLIVIAKKSVGCKMSKLLECVRWRLIARERDVGCSLSY